MLWRAKCCIDNVEISVLKFLTIHPCSSACNWRVPFHVIAVAFERHATPGSFTISVFGLSIGEKKKRILWPTAASASRRDHAYSDREWNGSSGFYFLPVGRVRRSVWLMRRKKNGLFLRKIIFGFKSSTNGYYHYYCTHADIVTWH